MWSYEWNVLFTLQSNPVKIKLQVQLEKIEIDNEVDVIDEELPSMPQNVLGLNHSEIMRKVNIFQWKWWYSQFLNSNYWKICDFQIMNHKNPQLQYNITNDTRKCFEDLEEDTSSRDEFKRFLHKRQVN